MEAVLILTELKNAAARDILVDVANAAHFRGDEIRQAAIWGLGRTGVKYYEGLLPFLDDADPDVALHAIAGFGSDTPSPVINALIGDLITSDSRRAPSASEALRLIGSDLALTSLIASIRGASPPSDWLIASLGRFPAAKVRKALNGDSLLDRIAPMLLLSSSSNWIADDLIDIDLKFLLKQNL